MRIIAEHCINWNLKPGGNDKLKILLDNLLINSGLPKNFVPVKQYSPQRGDVHVCHCFSDRNKGQPRTRTKLKFVRHEIKNKVGVRKLLKDSNFLWTFLVQWNLKLVRLLILKFYYSINQVFLNNLIKVSSCHVFSVTDYTEDDKSTKNRCRAVDYRYDDAEIIAQNFIY